MQQPNPVLAEPTRAAVERLTIVRAVLRWLQPDAEAQELMYRGNRVIGAILTANPIRLLTLLILTSILLLLLPSLLAHVAFIKDAAPKATKWPWVGFWQRWNWSAMYVLVLPAIFAVTAWLSRAWPPNFRGLTVPVAPGAKATVTKNNDSPASDFLDSISKDISRSGKIIFYSVLLLTAILTLGDIALLVHGYYLHLVEKVAFAFPDSDWSVAFQLKAPRFYFYGWTQRGPISNLAFNILAYSAQTLSIFFGFFWIAKYWTTLNSFSKQLIDNSIDFKFNAWWGDPDHRMGLREVGALFNGFLVVALLFQIYVFGHRLQLIARAGIDLVQYSQEIKAAPTDPHVLWAHRAFYTCTTGMWFLLIFVLLPAAIISWVPLWRFRKYLQRIIKQRRKSLRAVLDQHPDESPERKTALREWEEVNAANIWPNGDLWGWLFLTLMVILTVAAWFPPAVGYLVAGGGGVLILKQLKDLLPKPKAQ
jgi:hypothetical protein